MRLRTIKVVIGREYMSRVKKKSFLVTTFLVPVIFAAICVLPTIIMMLAEDKDKNVAVIDQSGVVMPFLESSSMATYTDYTDVASIEELKTGCKNMGLDAIVEISPLDSAKNLSVNTYSLKPISIDLKDNIASNVNDALEAYRVDSYEIADLKQIMNDVKADVKVSTYTIDESGQSKISSAEVYMGLSFILSTIIYMFIAMFSGMVMQSVIEEKASRVVEVLVSSVKATELMLGKIVGVAMVALTQFFLWIVLTAGIVGVVGGIVGFDKIAGSGDVEQISQMTGMDPSMLDAAGIDAEQIMAAASGEQGEIAAVLDTLKDINWAQFIIAFVVMFILGYLLYASLFAAIGSAVDNEADTQQLQLPVTAPLLIAFFIAIYAFKSPDSAVVWWGSMIPFTSPIVMLARIPYGVAAWELALSIALQFVTFLGCAWVSAKIYKVGILMFGKKSTFKDLWKWIRMK